MKAILRSINNFSCKLKQSNNLKYNISPKIRSNKFKNISGSGNIVIEDALNKDLKDYKIYGNTKQQLLPNGYTQVDYIETTGTQHIDTGVYGNLNTLLEIKASRTTLDNNNKQLASSLGNTYSITINIGPSNLTRFGTKSYSMRAHDYITADKPSIFICNKSGITIDGNSTGNFNEDTNFTTESTLYLMGANGSSTKFPGKLYYAKIYDNNVLIRYFIPCYRNSDNVIGLYDLVNNVFYTNQGTGVFTYGSVAPTPDAPIEMVSCGDRTKNLFDKENYNYIAAYLNASNIITNSEGATIFYIKCEPNTTYTVSKTKLFTNDRFCLFDIANIPQINDSALSYVGTRSGEDISTSLTITTSNNANYLCVFVQASPSRPNAIRDDLAKTIQIEEGSTATSYEPYGYKIPVNVRSRNLFDKDNANIINAFLYNNKCSIKEDYGDRTLILLAKPNTTYTVSRSVTTPTFRVAYTNNDLPTATSTRQNVNVEGQITDENASSITITTGNLVKYLLVCYGHTRDTNINESLASIQIEEGSIATNYQPYYNETTNIYLDEPLRKTKDGTYVDYIDFINQKVVRRIKETLLDDNITWLTGRFANEKRIYTSSSNIDSNMRAVTSNSQVGYLLSNQYKAEKLENILDLSVRYGIGISSTSYFSILNQDYASATDLLQALHDNPIVLDYVLRTPTEEDIELPNINLIEGKNIITIGTEVYGVFEVEYYSKEIIDISNYKYNLRKVED